MYHKPREQPTTIDICSPTLEHNNGSQQACNWFSTRVPDEVFEGFLLLGERGEILLFLCGSSIDQEIHSERPQVNNASKQD